MPISAELDSSYSIEIDEDKVTISVAFERMPLPISDLIRERADEIGEALFNAIFNQLDGEIVSKQTHSKTINGEVVSHDPKTVN